MLGQYKGPFGDIVFDPAKVRHVNGKIFISEAMVGPHAGQSKAWALSRLYGRIAFIEIGVPGSFLLFERNVEDIVRWYYDIEIPEGG